MNSKNTWFVHEFQKKFFFAKLKFSWFVHEFEKFPLTCLTKNTWFVHEFQKNFFLKNFLLNQNFHGLYMNWKNTWFVHEMKISFDFPYQNFMVCT